MPFICTQRPLAPVARCTECMHDTTFKRRQRQRQMPLIMVLGWTASYDLSLSNNDLFEAITEATSWCSANRAFQHPRLRFRAAALPRAERLSRVFVAGCGRAGNKYRLRGRGFGAA